MTNNTVCENYTLPSLGKIYDPPIDPNISIRSMTAAEEMRRLGKTDRMYETMSSIIDDCLVKKPNISSYDMCVGDYQFLLHKLRIVTYGPEYKVITTCPYCLQENSHVINLDDFKVNEYTDEIPSIMEFDLPSSKHHIKLCMQTPRMMDMITTKTNELKKKTRGDFSGDYSFIYTLMSLIDTVDYEKYDPIKLEDFVNALPMMDANYIIRKSEKLNKIIGIDTIVALNCHTCGLVYTPSFRINAEFFGPTIDD